MPETPEEPSTKTGRKPSRTMNYTAAGRGSANSRLPASTGIDIGSLPLSLTIQHDRSIIHDAKRKLDKLPMEQQPEPPPDQPEGHPEYILGRLVFVLAETARLQEEAASLVSQAREHGVTWAQIGEVTGGVSPQAAYQRWTETGRKKHREYEQKRRRS